MALQKDRIEIASDVQTRDGIGIEVYRNDELLVEIFRDDRQENRTITLYKPEILLEDMEAYIAVFKKEISWEFIK